VNGPERFMDILQSAQASLFVDSPSRLVPYMNHRGFSNEEISCFSRMADAHPESLSDIISSNDPASLMSAVSKLSKLCEKDGKLCVSLIDDLREASDLYFGRPQMRTSLFEVRSVRAVKDRNGSMVTKEFSFSPTGGGVALDRYKWSRSAVVIPDSVLLDGSAYPVVSISEGAFENVSFLKSVSLPNALTRIEDRAFSGCSELVSIGITSEVEHIAFDAFDGCDSLEKFDVDPGNRRYWSDSQGILYDKTENTLVQAPMRIAGDVVVPDSVVRIGDSAFFGCSGITSVVARGSIQSIGSWAFEGCTSLESVVLGPNMRDISSGAFFGCVAIKKMDIPEGTRTIDSRAFSGCSGMRWINLPDTLVNIGKWAFEGCTSLDSIVIPKSVSKLGQGFYYGCDSLTRLDADPANPYFQSDSYGMLYDKKRLFLFRCPKGIAGELKVKEGTTAVNERAFESCRYIESIVLPDSVGILGRRAFSGCSGIRSIVIPPLVKSIPDSTFTGCTSLESVTVPDSVTKIGCGAFSDCPSLKEIILPKGLTSIGYGAFDEGVKVHRRRRAGI